MTASAGIPESDWLNPVDVELLGDFPHYGTIFGALSAGPERLIVTPSDSAVMPPKRWRSTA